ncbi:hypothetical protein RSAG8_00252, partial [Rhizoctonia solani AG-8 WAC10335]
MYFHVQLSTVSLNYPTLPYPTQSPWIEARCLRVVCTTLSHCAAQLCCPALVVVYGTLVLLVWGTALFITRCPYMEEVRLDGTVRILIRLLSVLNSNLKVSSSLFSQACSTIHLIKSRRSLNTRFCLDKIPARGRMIIRSNDISTTERAPPTVSRASMFSAVIDGISGRLEDLHDLLCRPDPVSRWVLIMLTPCMILPRINMLAIPVPSPSYSRATVFCKLRARR